MREDRNYPAKLLLFGEYTVLAGSRALAIPLNTWSARWRFTGAPDPELVEFSKYLLGSAAAGFLDVKNFRDDVLDGLIFHSDIPRGYGVGSSAALTAAVYGRYFFGENSSDLLLLKARLAIMESFFHGQSSGIDPLVCFSRSAVLFGPGACDRVHLPADLSLQIFIVNSGKRRSTAPLVALFRERMQDNEFVRDVTEPISRATEAAIDSIISGDLAALWPNLDVISDIQFDRFGEMITPGVEEIWRRTAGHPGIWLKLCGAGGGGFFLGFAKPDVDVSDIIDCEYTLLDTRQFKGIDSR